MSENALLKKLRMLPGQRVLLMNAPEGYRESLGRVPGETTILTAAQGQFDFIQLFAKSKTELEKLAPRAAAALKPDGMFWICYPKKTSNNQSDLTMYHGWEITDVLGLDGVALISIDDTWSAARFRPKTSVKKKKQNSTSETAKYIDMAKRVVKLPKDFQDVLQKNKKALEVFNTLAFTNRKEYVVWIVEAKQDATRKKRIKLTLEKLKRGLKNPAAKK